MKEAVAMAAEEETVAVAALEATVYSPLGSGHDPNLR
jgi:hypothetical protein